jgi:hypothetical protein
MMGYSTRTPKEVSFQMQLQTAKWKDSPNLPISKESIKTVRTIPLFLKIKDI